MKLHLSSDAEGDSAEPDAEADSAEPDLSLQVLLGGQSYTYTLWRAQVHAVP